MKKWKVTREQLSKLSAQGDLGTCHCIFDQWKACLSSSNFAPIIMEKSWIIFSGNAYIFSWQNGLISGKPHWFAENLRLLMAQRSWNSYLSHWSLHLRKPSMCLGSISFSKKEWAWMISKSNIFLAVYLKANTNMATRDQKPVGYRGWNSYTSIVVFSKG